MSKRALKILVTGDSWSAGEFQGYEYLNLGLDRIKKNSIAKYLRDLGHEVDHAPFPGKSDMYVLDYVDPIASNYDYIILFKTSTMRAFKYFPFYTEHENSIFKPLTEKLDIASKEIYRRFSTYKSKLILVGGLEKIKKPYNYFYTIPSVCELIDSSFKDCEYFVDLRSLRFVDAALDKEGYKKHISNYEDKTSFMKKSKYFLDNCHPNRYVHKLLSKLINDHLQK